MKKKLFFIGSFLVVSLFAGVDSVRAESEVRLEGFQQSSLTRTLPVKVEER